MESSLNNIDKYIAAGEVSKLTNKSVYSIRRFVRINKDWKCYNRG